jgi:hypothetical protein
MVAVGATLMKSCGEWKQRSRGVRVGMGPDCWSRYSDGEYH